MEKEINIKNRKASFEYTLLDTYVAGIQLKGTEIKSIREGKAAIGDAFCFFDKGELFIKGLHITEYGKASFYNHAPLRDRKLLLHKKELRKIANAFSDGMAIVPLKLFINEGGWAKIQISLAKGKKQYDKRETIKKRELQRNLGRHIK
ncbi:MAG TPA: SsrA-binding protein SmpB [Bacteroidia bacterium]|nr:SsrA-binding protein SmpB [Bacteroidia bacterium]